MDFLSLAGGRLPASFLIMLQGQAWQQGVCPHLAGALPTAFSAWLSLNFVKAAFYSMYQKCGKRQDSTTFQQHIFYHRTPNSGKKSLNGDCNYKAHNGFLSALTFKQSLC
jgi:hypothetical protein